MEIKATEGQHSRALLLVEDDKATLDILGLMIARKFPGLRIHKAENGKRGVEQFKEHLPDIVLTAYSDENYLERFNKIGFSDYMLKPVDFKKLFAAIEKCFT